MERNIFKVIKGGKPLTFTGSPRKFKWAYVTNTRLMGVVFVCMCWQMQDQGAASESNESPNCDSSCGGEFYQLFYFDAEEYGLETYSKCSGKLELEQNVDIMSGGLGGINIDITEDEAISLVSSFIKYNKEHHIEMPGPEEEYMWMYDPKSEVAPETFAKMCEEIVTNYQLVNYYVMRLFGKDFEAADFLTDGYESIDHYPEIVNATLCKNTVDPIEGEAGSFMCEAVLELAGGMHNIVTCQVDTKDFKVTGFRPISKFRITPGEAVLKLGRTEFITLVHYMGTKAQFTREVTPLLKRSSMNSHETGDLYMIFKDDNSHVNRKVFQLNSDVYGTFYVMDAQHILISSFDEETVAVLEKALGASYLGPKCRVRKRYEFSTPVLSMFIESEMTNFKAFVEMIEDK